MAAAWASPHNQSSQFSGVFCDSQAFSGIISLSRDSRLPLHKRTNKISRKNEILILQGTGCITASGTLQKSALLHFWTNGKPVLGTVQFPEGVPSVEDRIGGSAIQVIGILWKSIGRRCEVPVSTFGRTSRRRDASSEPQASLSVRSGALRSVASPSALLSPAGSPAVAPGRGTTRMAATPAAPDSASPSVIAPGLGPFVRASAEAPPQSSAALNLGRGGTGATPARTLRSEESKLFNASPRRDKRPKLRKSSRNPAISNLSSNRSTAPTAPVVDLVAPGPASGVGARGDPAPPSL